MILLRLIFLLLLLSCASKTPVIQSSKEMEAVVQNSLNKVCLSSEGKAKIQYADGKNFVGYSSHLKVAEKEWGIGFDIPLHGEETLILNWSRFPDENLVIDGSIVAKMDPEKFQSGESQAYYQGIVSFLEWILFVQNKSSNLKNYQCWGQSDTELNSGRCQLNFSNSSSQEVRFEFKHKKNHFYLPFGESKMVVMILDLENEKYFERMSFSVVEKDLGKEQEIKAGLEFLVRSCDVR